MAATISRTRGTTLNNIQDESAQRFIIRRSVSCVPVGAAENASSGCGTIGRVGPPRIAPKMKRSNE
jgi:hypothetical protein